MKEHTCTCTSSAHGNQWLYMIIPGSQLEYNLKATREIPHSDMNTDVCKATNFCFGATCSPFCRSSHRITFVSDKLWRLETFCTKICTFYHQVLVFFLK